MRRRLDLAASLITRPPLIFLDEPTTGLDPRTRREMYDTIRGRKVAEGTPDELKTSVGNSTLQLRLAPGADPELARQVVRRVTSAEPVLAAGTGQLNMPLDAADRAADVLVGLRQAGLEIASVSVSRSGSWTPPRRWPGRARAPVSPTLSARPCSWPGAR